MCTYCNKVTLHPAPALADAGTPQPAPAAAGTAAPPVAAVASASPCPAPLPALLPVQGGAASGSAPVSGRRGAASASAGGPRPGSLRRRLAHSSADLVQRSLEELPPTARDLVRLLDNLDSVLELVSAFGGGTWYIPTQWPLPGTRGGKGTHPLRGVLDQAQMQSLTRYYGGTQLYIPRCQRALQRLRNARIVQSFSAGVARGRSSRDLVRGLARRHHLTDRRVWDILKTLS